MSQLFHKTFSDALTGANGFDSFNESNGTITQTAGAGLHGTSGGVTVTRTTGAPNIFGSVTADFTGKTLLRTAWFTDVSLLAIATIGNHCLLYSLLNAAATESALFLRAINIGGVRSLRHQIFKDDTTSATDDITLGNPEWIELRIQRASGSGVADGESQLYFGGGDYEALGEPVSEHTDIANFARFEKALHRIGMFSAPANVEGSLILDEWTMQDSDEAILFGVETSVSRRVNHNIAAIRRRRAIMCNRRGVRC